VGKIKRKTCTKTKERFAPASFKRRSLFGFASTVVCVKPNRAGDFVQLPKPSRMLSPLHPFAKQASANVTVRLAFFSGCGTVF
jgi:hypothetical protein